MRYLFRLLTAPLRFLARLAGRGVRWLQLRWGGDAARRRREASRLASTLLSEFHRLGFTKRVSAGRKKTKRQRVRFEYPLLLTRDELWCPLDLRRLPQGVRTDDLRDPAVVQSLEDRCHAAVRPDYLPNGKFCFVVRLGGAAFPETFSINRFEMPPDAPLLAVPFGIDATGQQVLIDLLELKHLFVGGATGGGKTTFLHVAISTLIGRNTADELELWLVDLKRTEFNLYRSLLGKRGQGGVVRHLAVEPEQAVEVLDAAYKEIIRRNRLMEQSGVTNIDDLNRMTGQRLKRVVIAVDEFAILTTDKTKIGRHTIGSWATLLMTRIAALGRSAGVTIVIATQMVNKEVVSSSIRANFENRLTFSCADWRQSQLIVETSEADGLPAGRAVLRKEGKTMEVQTCFITPQQVRLEVARIVEFGPDGGLGDQAELARLVKDAKLLLDAACTHFNGDFTRAKLLTLDGIRGVISQERFAEVAQRLEREGVLEAGGPRKPRRVVRAFFGRPGLLHTLFGWQDDHTDANQTPTVPPPDHKRLAEHDHQMPQQNAANVSDAHQGVMVYGLDSSAACPPPEDEPDPDLPAAFGDLFDELDQPKKPKKPKKPKRPPENS